MLLTAQEMKVFSFNVLCREIWEIRAMLMFFNESFDNPKNQREKLWMDWINGLTYDEMDELEEILKQRISILRVLTKNIKKELVYSEQQILAKQPR